MLDPAPPPEGDRGGAVPFLDDATRKAMGEQAVALAKAVQVPERRHRRVRRRQGPELLLPGDEHPPAGRASGDRADHRPRPGRADDPRRRRREAAARAGGREARTAGRSSAASTPRTRSATSCRRPAGWCKYPRARSPSPRRARRHRRLRGRRDLDVLRSDDRQALHATAQTAIDAIDAHARARSTTSMSAACRTTCRSWRR